MNDLQKRDKFEQCKTLADKIIFSLKYQPEDWKKDELYLVNKKNNFILDTRIGWIRPRNTPFAVKEEKGIFSFFEKIRLRIAIIKWRRKDRSKIKEWSKGIKSAWKF